MKVEHVLTRERRVEQRAHDRRDVGIRCWMSHGGVERYLRLVDLGVEGARVATVTPPEVGQQVALRFVPPRARGEVRALGRVVWRSEGFRGRGGIAGVVFDEVVGAHDLVNFVGGDDHASPRHVSPRHASPRG